MMSIIGAGPAGSNLASLMKYDDVTLFEQKKIVGYPVACTGILTDSINSVTRIPTELIVSKIRKFRIIAPNKSSVLINLGKENLVVDRKRFDQHIHNKAIDNGAKIMVDHRFMGLKKLSSGRLKLLFDKNRSYETDYVVGADGPRSTVARSAGMYGRRSFLQGLQARVKGEFTPGITDIHFGTGEFAWVVPENESYARIGVVGNNVHNEFKSLVKGREIVEDQSGIIPLFDPRQKLQKGNVSLIGDAALQVKPTTYGGIIYGLLAGKYISEGWKDYPKKFRKKLHKDLWISLKMREAMNKFSDEDCEDLVDVFKKEGNKVILEEHDRDFPSRFIFQLLLKETKLWKLGFKLFT